MNEKPKIRWLGLLSAAGTVATAFSILAFAGQLYWLLDLAAHFRVQSAIGLGLITLLLAVGREWRSAAFAGCGATLNLAVLLPYFFSSASLPVSDAPKIRLALINVNTANRRFDLVRDFIRTSKADVVAVQEVNGEWMSELAGLRSIYPHVAAQSREDNFGIALFSRRPFAREEILHLGKVRVPSVLGELDVGGRKLQLLTTHPVPPRTRAGTRLRDDQLAAVAEVLKNLRGTRVLLGDLNASPWSAEFRKLVRETGLHDSARGMGLQLTWPSQPWFLRVPIDHCLISPDLRVVARQVGSDVGSDHFPIIVELAGVW